MKRLILALLCVLSNICIAQEVIVNASLFGVKDGIIDRSVFGVTQDDRGFIWIATGNGICRFDGDNFKKVRGSGNGISVGMIVGIQTDNFGHLWIQKGGEPAVVFDPKKEALLPLPIEEKVRGGNLEILNLSSQGGIIFLKNEIGQLFFLNDQNVIVPYGDILYDNPRVKLRPTEWNTLIVEDQNAATYQEVNIDGIVKRQFQRGIRHQDVLDAKGNFLRIVFSSKNLNLKLADILLEFEASGSLKAIDLKKNGRSLSLKDLELPKEKYLGLTKDSKGNIWLSINEKLWLFDPEGNYVADLSSKLLELSDGVLFKINQMFIDDEDRLWLSSGLGLFLLEVKENAFKNFLTTDKITSVRGIIEVLDSCLLVNTYSGTKLINKKTSKVLRTFDYLGLGIAEDEKGNVWIGQHSSKLVSIGKEDLSTENYRETVYPIKDGEGIQENFPFYDQRSGSMYLGSNFGLFLFDENCSCFKTHPKNNNFKEITKKRILFFYANDDAIWIATNNGVYQLDREKGLVNNFQFLNNSIKHIHEDADGIFWLATGGGLIKWNRKDEKVRLFTENDGLSHNVLYAVYEDSSNNLWLPSNKGLMRFDKTSENIDVLQKEDGIPHEEFNTFSHYKGKDGRFYFGGIGGLTSFFPEDMIFEENIAPFLITDVQLFDFEKGQLINKTKEVEAKEELVLKDGDKFFTVNFSLLDYSANNHIYAWKIDGLEEEWNYQAENSIRINSLPHGNYNLLIKAKGSGSKWAKNQLALPIKVQKPFYLRWEFICMAIGLIALLIYGIVKWRISRLARSREKLKHLVKERTNELSEKNKELEKLNQFKDKIYSIIAHDLRDPAFALQDIGKKIDYLLKTKQFERLNEFGKTVDESINTLNTLLNNLLSWANQNMGGISLNAEPLSIVYLLNQTVRELKLSIGKKSIVINNSVSTDLETFADRQTVLTIMRNLLANAIKFSPPNGAIHLSAELKSKNVIIHVKDNGIGIEKERLLNIFDPKKNKSTLGSMGEKGTGLGLGVSKELALLNGGDIYVTSTIGEGSTFSIVLPTFDNH